VAQGLSMAAAQLVLLFISAHAVSEGPRRTSPTIVTHKFEHVSENVHEGQIGKLKYLLAQGVPGVMHAPKWHKRQAATLTFDSLVANPNATLHLRQLLWSSSVDKHVQVGATKYQQERMAKSGRKGETLADQVPIQTAAEVAATISRHFDTMHEKGWATSFMPVGEGESMRLTTRCSGPPSDSPGYLDSFGLGILPNLKAQTSGAIQSVPQPWSAPWSKKGQARAGTVLWFGASSGAIHYDNEDNVLMQMSGTKTIVVWHANATRPICKAIDVPEERVPAIGGFKLGNIKWMCDVVSRPSMLSQLLFNEAKVITLRPGLGAILPAGAFHSPVATSPDSLSLSSSFFPNGHTQPRPLPSKYAMELNARLGYCQRQTQSGTVRSPDYCVVV